MKISREDAFIFSLIKWQFLSKKDYMTGYSASCALVDEYPLLDELRGRCGLCHYKYQRNMKTCVLSHFKRNYCYEVIACEDYSHIYSAWSLDPTKENAKVVYKKILELAEREMG